MATITQRKQADGSPRYTAQIRLRLAGEAHRESKTFSTKSAATAWAKKREDELKAGGQPVPTVSRVKIRKLIGDYLADRGPELGRSKLSHLNFLLGQDLAELDAIALSPAQLVAHVRERRAGGTGPATVLNDLIWLRVVWRHAKLHRIPVAMAPIEEATSYCKAEKLIAKSRQRVRRPTSDELRRIGEWFLAPKRARKPGPPMDLIMWAAIYSCRRQAELFNLRLSDYDRERGTWLVRSVKHPGGSTGHDLMMRVTERFAYLVETIIKEVSRQDDRLLPFNPKSIGTYWRRQMSLIGIEDLHFHDLRRHGCSLLAEAGWTIPQIQQVSLHESWGSLQIYVNMSQNKSSFEFGPTC